MGDALAELSQLVEDKVSKDELALSQKDQDDALAELSQLVDDKVSKDELALSQKDQDDAFAELSQLVDDKVSKDELALSQKDQDDALAVLLRGVNQQQVEQQQEAARILQEVEKAGGAVAKTPGSLGMSLEWNNDEHPADLDLHAVTTKGEVIKFNSKASTCGGKLDVDMQANVSGQCVENIIWDKAPEGEYQIKVHGFTVPGPPKQFQVVLVRNGCEREMFHGQVGSKELAEVHK